MERIETFPIALTFALIAAICLPVDGQTVPASSMDGFAVTRAKDDARSMPFSPESGLKGHARAIEFLSANQMTEEDRKLEAGAEPAIREKAGIADLGFNEGKWSYRQVACTALPGHLLLRFTRNDGPGNVSMFSVSVPRASQGAVHMIPIQRRSFSLFSPAPMNAMTIAVFNRIRAEEQPEDQPNWLETGLCYAALAGANPQVEPLPVPHDSSMLPVAPSAVLEIPAEGGAVIEFTDTAGVPGPADWKLTFDGKGKLLKASSTQLPQFPVKFVPQGGALANGTLSASNAPLEQSSNKASNGGVKGWVSGVYRRVAGLPANSGSH
jgi:hypothetical protein